MKLDRQLERERKVFETAILENPEQKSLHARLCMVLVELGETVPEEVERAGLESYLAQDPDRADLRRRLCGLYLAQGEMLTAREIALAFPDYPGQLAMYEFLAPAYRAAQDRAMMGCIETPARVLFERFPECPCCLYFHASWLFHFGDRSRALRLLEQARDLVSGYEYLAQLYLQVLMYEGGRPDGNPALLVKAREFIRSYFVDYTGDLWRSPQFRARQMECLDRDLPPILIVTLLKSGSLFLLNTLSHGLSIPHTYLCPLGLFYDFLVEQRVRDFADGGAIAVDHPDGSERNLDMLFRFGIRKIVFHYRDVRQAALSFVHHNVSDEILTVPRTVLVGMREEIEQHEGAFESSFRIRFAFQIESLRSWVARIEQDSRFQFLVTNFDDLNDEPALIARILEFYDIPDKQFDWSLLDCDKKQRAGHFRRGLVDEWREVLAPSLQEEVNTLLCEDSVLERLSVLHESSWKCRSK